MLPTAKLYINLKKLQTNAHNLLTLLNSKQVQLLAITKVIQGDIRIAQRLIRAGVKDLGDSRIQNIARMQMAGIKAHYFLIRVPGLHEIPQVVKYCDVSVNTELILVKMLSMEAIRQNKKHGVILMVELGDLREGINLEDLEEFVGQVLQLKGIELVGIGVNFKCFAGVIPTPEKMQEFSDIAKKVQEKFGITFKIVSGGNSANIEWVLNSKNVGYVNNLRIGEALFLGKETLNYSPIPTLYTDVFQLSAEILEIKERPFFPNGIIGSDAFGEPSPFHHPNLTHPIEGRRIQALLDIGEVDVKMKGIFPTVGVEILGASSDYMVVDLKNLSFDVGESINFKIDYGALMRIMLSPHIEKIYLESN